MYVIYKNVENVYSKAANAIAQNRGVGQLLAQWYLRLLC